jgi:crossover junction endodeoxyribonuclease RuvC
MKIKIKILGVDPGLTKTGWGIILSNQNNISFIASGIIHTDASMELSERIKFLHENISKVVDLYQPDEAAVEEIFINKNPTSSLKLGHARGAIMLSLALKNLKIYEYATTAIKKTVTGVGRADKNQIGVMVKCLLPKATFKTEDEADALAVTICHNNQRDYLIKLSQIEKTIKLKK